MYLLPFKAPLLLHKNKSEHTLWLSFNTTRSASGSLKCRIAYQQVVLGAVFQGTEYAWACFIGSVHLQCEYLCVCFSLTPSKCYLARFCIFIVIYTLFLQRSTLNFLFCGETFFVLLHHLNPVFEELFHDCIKTQRIWLWRLCRMCCVRVTRHRFIVLQPSPF